VTGRASTRVEIGVIAKAHGLTGEVVVAGARLSADEFRAVRTLLARAKDGGVEALTVTAARPFVAHLLVRFDGVTDKDGADALRGRVREADAALLTKPAEGEIYLFQLIGLRVQTVEGRALGEIKDVWSTGAAPVLVVRDPAAGAAPGAEPAAKPRERLIPMSPDVLVGVDLEAGTVEVRLLPGMEDL